VLGKLIPKLQAFSKSIQEAPMVRFYSSIYADDKMLISQMSGDSVFHEIPHPNRCRTSKRRPNASAAFPTIGRVAYFVSEIRSFWRNAMTFEAEVAEVPLRYAVFLTFLRAAKPQMCLLFVVGR